jgi:hypothetical protein
MLIARTLIVTASLILWGVGLPVPALAQQVDAAFEYSPVARMLPNGQFRAEVWRRDIAADRSEVAWSDAEPVTTSALAIAEACASLKQNFDPAFQCPRIATPPPQLRAAVKPSAFGVPPVPVKTAPPPAPDHKPAVANTPPRPSTPAPPPMVGGNAWVKDFWQVRDRAGVGGTGGE